MLAELIEWCGNPAWVLRLDSAEAAFWQAAVRQLAAARREAAGG